MVIADRLHEEGAMQGKHEGVLRIVQEMMEKGLNHEVILALTRFLPDDPTAPSH